MTNSYYGFILLYKVVISCCLYCNWELDVLILMDFYPVTEVKLSFDQDQVADHLSCCFLHSRSFTLHSCFQYL